MFYAGIELNNFRNVVCHKAQRNFKSCSRKINLVLELDSRQNRTAQCRSKLLDTPVFSNHVYYSVLLSACATVSEYMWAADAVENISTGRCRPGGDGWHAFASVARRLGDCESSIYMSTHARIESRSRNFPTTTTIHGGTPASMRRRVSSVRVAREGSAGRAICRRSALRSTSPN